MSVISLSRTMKGLRLYSAKKSPLRSFMGAGRRHETPGTETKNFATHGTAEMLSISACHVYMYTDILVYII